MTTISPGHPSLNGTKPPTPQLTLMERLPSVYNPPHSSYFSEAGDQPKNFICPAWVCPLSVSCEVECGSMSVRQLVGSC